MFGINDPDSPVDMVKLQSSILAHEKNVLYVYDDATGLPIEKGYTVQGNPTIGIGRLLTKAKGLTNAESAYLNSNDLQSVVGEAQTQAWWPHVSGVDARARAFIELLYNLGQPRLDGFVKALAAAAQDDWDTCSNEFKNSEWYNEVGSQPGERGFVICWMIKTGADYAPSES